MVMHARKPQRISDGYFEKHQAHPYQNSKYSSSKGNYAERYNHERMRDSPNGNSYRSDSPDSQSPRDRSYQNKSSYLQKIREKERDNRDYKSRDKYSDCARSPKDKRNRESRDSEHRTNHDRSSTEEKREDRDRVPRVGDWSEHISSSGKKYYYNCKTEVSQWEKPREWMERERGRIKDRDRDSDRNYSSSSRSSHDKHSNSRASISNTRDQKSTSRQGDGREMYWNNQSCGSREDGECHDKRKQMDESQAQDMDISPGDSTPTSETSYTHTPTSAQDLQNTGPVLLSAALPRLISHPTTPTTVPPTLQRPQTFSMGKPSPQTPTQTQPQAPSQSQVQPQQQVQPTPVSMVQSASVTTSSASGTPVSLASLPRLLSQITAAKGLQNLEQSELSPQKALQTIQTLLSRQVSLEPGGVGYDGGGGTTSSGQVPVVTPTSQLPLQPLKVDTSNNTMLGEGPPTPTHSESQDGVDARKVNSPPSSLSSLQNLSQAGGSSLHALRPQGPHLTPSLANHYRDDLVNHVRGWPADVIEKQAQKLSEEAHTMGSLHCTKVSADLKTSRSIVRYTEIQATLQEQRILFLRQQIRELEKLKSQNSFMSDS